MKTDRLSVILCLASLGAASMLSGCGGSAEQPASTAPAEQVAPSEEAPAPQEPATPPTPSEEVAPEVAPTPAGQPTAATPQEAAVELETIAPMPLSADMSTPEPTEVARLREQILPLSNQLENTIKRFENSADGSPARAQAAQALEDMRAQVRALAEEARSIGYREGVNELSQIMDEINTVASSNP